MIISVNPPILILILTLKWQFSFLFFIHAYRLTVWKMCENGKYVDIEQKTKSKWSYKEKSGQIMRMNYINDIKWKVNCRISIILYIHLNINWSPELWQFPRDSYRSLLEFEIQYIIQYTSLHNRQSRFDSLHLPPLPPLLFLFFWTTWTCLFDIRTGPISSQFTRDTRSMLKAVSTYYYGIRFTNDIIQYKSNIYICMCI